MTATVILCRHGNTFDKGEKVVMVGAREDLPLTEEGRAQAGRMAAAIASSGLVIDRVLCGPLQRTKVYAELIVQQLGSSLQPKIDSRLVELDYGAWGGLSNEEISERYGADVLSAWSERGIRPHQTPFSPSADVLAEETKALLDELALEGGVSLVITSNGRLREYARLLASQQQLSHKVKTGHASVLMHSSSTWRIIGWDLSPELLAKC
jgi:broad specificity phosphatase PhoE